MQLHFQAVYRWVIRMVILGLSFPAIAQSNITGSRFEDWQVVCTDEGPCRMSQTIVQLETQRLILQAQVYGGDTPTLLLSFPLGVLLSPGWTMQIDGQTKQAFPFEICRSDGCFAGVPLTPQLITAMQRGRALSIVFFDAAQQEVAPEISLIGFTAAGKR
ncbi:invasion associated locus B family protein [Yoonia sp. GPGPB17]|uniref:invasion associated locus B family protein n=1 Tax=Yoonia sp. GPGPB17 TaxID=3026147 RepID=UPI0030BDA22D